MRIDSLSPLQSNRVVAHTKIGDMSSAPSLSALLAGLGPFSEYEGSSSPSESSLHRG
jgi:hypothetical protein